MKPAVHESIVGALTFLIVFALIMLVAAFACAQHPASCQVMKPMGHEWRCGSAGLVSPQLVITNHHVAGGSGRVRVAWPTGKVINGSVLGADQINDVAVIKLDKVVSDIRPFKLREVGPAPGSIGYQDGAPGRSKTWITRRVKVLGTTHAWGRNQFIRWGPRSYSGDSGGPLYGRDGVVYAFCAMTNERETMGPPAYSACQLLRRLFPGCIKNRQFQPP